MEKAGRWESCVHSAASRKHDAITAEQFSDHSQLFGRGLTLRHLNSLRRLCTDLCRGRTLQHFGMPDRCVLMRSCGVSVQARAHQFSRLGPKIVMNPASRVENAMENALVENQPAGPAPAPGARGARSKAPMAA